MNYPTWKSLIPYGKWTCADGREVLFNRRYRPILERKLDGSIGLADPGEWVPRESQDYFFNDGNSPWHYDSRRRRETLARVNSVLTGWGMPSLPSMPRTGRSWHAKTATNPWQEILRAESLANHV
jgi:hypothetical protein